MKNEISIDQMLKQYDAFTIDLWGVVHDGCTPYPGVVDCLNEMLRLDKQLIFLSNAPRPGHLVMQKLLEFGIPVKPSMMLTSGDMVRYQLMHFEDAVFKNLGRRCYHLGSERNQDILVDVPVNRVRDLDQTDFILSTVFLEEEEDRAQYDAFFKEAIERNIPMICANPDKKVVQGQSYRYCAGIFAERYIHLGGQCHYYGKPSVPIFEEAFKRLSTFGFTCRKRILMIGDTLETDIAGAICAGIDSAWVLTGNAQLYFDGGSPQEDTRYACSPTWVLPKLAL